VTVRVGVKDGVPVDVGVIVSVEVGEGVGVWVAVAVLVGTGGRVCVTVGVKVHFFHGHSLPLLESTDASGLDWVVNDSEGMSPVNIEYCA